MLTTSHPSQASPRTNIQNHGYRYHQPPSPRSLLVARQDIRRARKCRRMYVTPLLTHPMIIHSFPTVLAALKPAYEGVIAEPENTFFEVFQNPSNPGEFRFIEHWNATAEWFMSVSRSESSLNTADSDCESGPAEEGVLWAVP